MKRRTRWALGAALLAVAVGLTVPAVVGADPDHSAAAVQFGDPSVGSPFPPPVFDHDESSNARDNLVPRTAVISTDGKVTFTIRGLHQVAVYAAGTKSTDIVQGDPGALIPPGVNDETNRIALSARNLPPTNVGTFEHTFTAPGRYLVICNIAPHFFRWDMYGWVNVK